MPRTLPWLTGSSSSKAEDAASSPRRREVKHEKDSDHGAEETPKASKSSTSRANKRDFLRSSPSPPPTPIQRCPSEEYLIEGFDNDDIYMMVEDEFYAMAQTFTQHLHYAEYMKRKKEAKLHNLADIKDLDRATDGTTPKSEETKRKEAAAALSARQRAGLEKIEGKRPQLDSDKEDDTDEDDGLVGTSLGYLMTSPRKARSLVGMQSIKSSTRAAAGFAQASGAKRQKTSVDAHTHSSPEPEVEEDDHAADATATEDDDLDVQITKTSPRRTAKKPPISDLSSPILRTNSSTPQYTDNDDKGKRPAHAIHRTQTSGRTRKKVFFDDDFDQLPEPSDASLKSHTANNTKDPKESVLHSKKSRLNEVPTFLF